jgi:hypothetical protein
MTSKIDARLKKQNIILIYSVYLHTDPGKCGHTGSCWNFHSISSRIEIKYFRFGSVILDFWSLGSFDSIQSSFTEKLVPENVGLPLEFSSITSGYRDTSTSGFVAAILDFWGPVTSKSIDNRSLGKRMLSIVGGAVVFSILLAIQAKLQQLLCCIVVNMKVFPV